MPMDPPISIEGLTADAILELPNHEIDSYIFTGEPIELNAGSAQILGRFTLGPTRLTVELAHYRRRRRGRTLDAVDSRQSTCRRPRPPRGRMARSRRALPAAQSQTASRS